MSSFKPGDVIALPYFPNQENPNEGTARYAMIVEVYNDKYLFYPFTKQLHQVNNYKKTKTIIKNSPLGQKMGLKYDSILVMDREWEIHKIVAKPPVLGNCGDEFLEEIGF